MGHRHRRARYARPTAGRDDLRLELGAVFAPASTATADFVGDSVHVSTKSFVDTSILKRSAAIKVPRRDAYARSSEAKARLVCPAAAPRACAAWLRGWLLALASGAPASRLKGHYGRGSLVPHHGQNSMPMALEPPSWMRNA